MSQVCVRRQNIEEAPDNRFCRVDSQLATANLLRRALPVLCKTTRQYRRHYSFPLPLECLPLNTPLATTTITTVYTLFHLAARGETRTFGDTARANWHKIYDVKGKLAGEVLLSGRTDNTRPDSVNGHTGQLSLRCVCVRV